MSEWVKGKPRASWHLLATWTRVSGRAITVCGRVVEDAHSAATPPMGERSCETCFRLREMRAG